MRRPAHKTKHTLKAVSELLTQNTTIARREINIV